MVVSRDHANSLWLVIVVFSKLSLACKQAPGELAEYECSPGRAGRAESGLVMKECTGEPVDIPLMPPFRPGIKIWLVESMNVDSFEINNWHILRTACKFAYFCRDQQRWLLRAMHSSLVFTELDEAASSNSLHHFLHISDLKHKQKLCLEIDSSLMPLP